MRATLADFEPLWPAEQGLVEWLQAGNREEYIVSDALPSTDAPHDLRPFGKGPADSRRLYRGRRASGRRNLRA